MSMVTQTRKYGGKRKDASVVTHLNLTGSLSNHATFESWMLPQCLTQHKDNNGIFYLMWEHCIFI